MNYLNEGPEKDTVASYQRITASVFFGRAGRAPRPSPPEIS